MTRIDGRLVARCMALLAGVALCTTANAAQKELVIGVSDALTGPGAV